ncbi:MAG: efflux RND transporter periplasmic adaptor subunit [Bacteroidales bacterium]|nr:efflux RND transporter periplasmic adaptor subunit [Bacteroidales bacterium]
MKKFLKILLAVVLVALFGGTFYYLWRNSRPKEVSYEEIHAERADIRKTTVVTGKIQPRDEVNIKPQINGIIAELYKEAGQPVAAGEVIAKLKVIPEMSSLSAAQSRVRLAGINLSQAKTNYERDLKLHDKSLISDDEFERTAQALAQAKEEQAAAQDALEVIRDGVSSSNAKSSSTLVRSTISGLILDIPVKVGNSVIQANTLNDGTTVATVVDMNDLIFDGNIDETEVGRLVEGMPMVITVGALQDLSFGAQLEYIAPKAVESNGTNQFEIKAAVKVPEGNRIRSGYSANAEIVLQSAENVISLPESVLEFSGDSTFVYKVGAAGYEKTPVKTGLSDGLRIEIVSGIDESDTIRGNRKL